MLEISKNRTETISLFRKLKETDQEVAGLFDVICLMCPYILDDPEGAADSIVRTYTRLVRFNISIIETREKLLII